MSMILCDRCNMVIDSDDDPDCFVETGNQRRLHETTILCETCRDKRQAKEEDQQ
jgi:hypothetical protein